MVVGLIWKFWWLLSGLNLLMKVVSGGKRAQLSLTIKDRLKKYAPPVLATNW